MNRENRVQLIGMIADAFLTPEQHQTALIELDELYDQVTVSDTPLDVADPAVLAFMRIAVFIIHHGGEASEETYQGVN